MRDRDPEGYAPHLLDALVFEIRKKLAGMPFVNGHMGLPILTVTADSRAVARALCARMTEGEVARLRWRYRDEE